MIEEISQIVAAFGWESVPSKVGYMISFKKQDADEYIRLNIYITTMTVQIQSEHSNKVWKNVDMQKLEEIVMSN